MKQGYLSPQDKIIIYKSKDNQIRLEVRLDLDKDTLWLSQAQIARLFKTDRSVITRHIRNIFKLEELDEKSNVHFLHIALSDKPANFGDNVPGIPMCPRNSSPEFPITC